MTQREIDNAVSIINEANTQLRVTKDRLDTQEWIIKAQTEMIEILKSNVASRDKYISILEKQLALQDNAIVRNSNSSKQSLND